MSTAVLERSLPPDAPTQEELTRELRNLAPSMFVYNPAPDWVRIEHGGRDYWLPPDRGGIAVEHPVDKVRDARGDIVGAVMVAADGRLGLRDLWGGKDYQKGVATKYGPLDGQSAWEIVVFMAHHHADRGIIYLRGNQDDAPRMLGAKRAYQIYIRSWALEQQQARAAFVENWRLQPGNKGRNRTPPPPTRAELQAQEILDEMGEERREVAAFICRVCFGYETSDWEKFRRHMESSHDRHNLRQADFDPSAEEKGGRRRQPDEVDDEDEDDNDDEATAKPRRVKPAGKKR